MKCEIGDTRWHLKTMLKHKLIYYREWEINLAGAAMECSLCDTTRTDMEFTQNQIMYASKYTPEANTYVFPTPDNLILNIISK